MPVFFVCAGLLGLLAVSLTISVGHLRGKKKISLGDGGDPELQAAIRAHGNFMEYVPLSLLVIYLAGDFVHFWTIAVLSAALLVGRALHAGGMLGFVPRGRMLGAATTVIVLAVASALLIVKAIDLHQY